MVIWWVLPSVALVEGSTASSVVELVSLVVRAVEVVVIAQWQPAPVQHPSGVNNSAAEKLKDYALIFQWVRSTQTSKLWRSASFRRSILWLDCILRFAYCWD